MPNLMNAKSIHRMAKAMTPTRGSSRDVDVADNANAVITYPALPGRRHCIDGVAWSYSAEPTGGRLVVQNGAGHTCFDWDITGTGAGWVPVKRESLVGNALIIILYAAGQGVIGKVNALNYWPEGS